MKIEKGAYVKNKIENIDRRIELKLKRPNADKLAMAEKMVNLQKS